MHTTSRNPSQQSNLSSDPFWMLVLSIVFLVLAIWGLPALLIALLVQRVLAKLLHWKLSLLLWLVSTIVGVFLLLHQYQTGLQAMMIRELALYVLEAKRYQMDFAHWHLRLLWGVTWPMWVRTLVGVPLAGLWFEVSAHSGPQDVLKQLQRKERQQKRHTFRAQVHARKRTRRPERLPDSINGMMVIGVPINEKEE
jgi:hypothetical protein